MDGEAGKGGTQAHGQGFYAEVEQEAGQRVTLADTPAEGEPSTISAIYAHPQVAGGDDVSNRGV